MACSECLFLCVNVLLAPRYSGEIPIQENKLFCLGASFAITTSSELSTYAFICFSLTCMVLAVTLIACFFFFGGYDIFEVRVRFLLRECEANLVTVWCFSVMRISKRASPLDVLITLKLSFPTVADGEWRFLRRAPCLYWHEQNSSDEEVVERLSTRID